MPRFYPIAVQVDGRRYTGDWTLMQGGRICVRSAYGSEIAELGRARPELLSLRLLERIVRGYEQQRARAHERQERERLKLTKKKPPAAKPRAKSAGDEGEERRG